MSSKRAGKLKDDILGQIGEQIKALQLRQQTIAENNDTDGYVVTVKNIHLQCLLDLLDHVLLLGLHDIEFGYWPFVSKFTHSETIRLIAEHPQVTNDLDKGRVWVYMATSDGLWESYIRAFTDGQKVAKKFYNRHSLVRDKERLCLLLTLVSGLDFIDITLDQFLYSLVFNPRWQKRDNGRITLKERNSEELRVTVFSPYLGYGTFDPNSSADDCTTVRAKTDEIIITTRRRKGSTSTASSFSNASTITAPLSPTSPTTSEYDSSDTFTCVDDVAQSPQTVPSNTAQQNEEKVMEFEPEIGNTEEGFQNQEHGSSTGTDKTSFILKQYPTARDSATNILYFNEPGLGIKNRTPLSINAKGFKGEQVMMDEVDILYCHHQPKVKKSSKKETHVKKATHDFTDNDEKLETEEKVQQTGQNSDNTIQGEDEKVENYFRVETVRQDSTSSSHSVGSDGHHVGSPGSLNSSYTSGDSMDQFCRDFDSSSLNDNSVDDVSVQFCQNELTESHEDHDSFYVAKNGTTKTPTTSSSVEADNIDATTGLQTSAEYEGIVLGLPRRPIISEVNCSSADNGVDQNTLLMLSLEVFLKNGEQLQRMLRLRTGHRSGVPRSVFVAVTDQAIYVLRRVPSQSGLKFKTENVFALTNTTKIHIGLNFQTIGFVTKGNKCVLTICDEAVARSLMSTITTLLLKSNQPAPLSGIVSNSHIQQETRINKWLKETDENTAPNTEIACFSLVHWSCFAGPDSFLELMSFQSLKEGYIDYKGHNVLGMTTRWIQGYFILTNGNLYQYNQQGDSHPKQVLNLKNSRCGGCRRLNDPDRPFAFEIVSFSGSPLLVLATESENEASDWIYRLCQTIADSFETKEEMGCKVTRCIPCCIIATKNKVVTFLEDDSSRYRLLSTCPVQGISKLYIDNEYRNYCILRFDCGDIGEVESTWFVWFNTEYELGKFERAVAEAWKELFQVDLQFLVLGNSFLRKKARDHVESIVRTYES